MGPPAARNLGPEGTVATPKKGTIVSYIFSAFSSKAWLAQPALAPFRVTRCGMRRPGGAGASARRRPAAGEHDDHDQRDGGAGAWSGDPAAPVRPTTLSARWSPGPWCVCVVLAALAARAGAGPTAHATARLSTRDAGTGPVLRLKGGGVRTLSLRGHAAVAGGPASVAGCSERRTQLQLERASRRSWVHPEGFGNLPYRRPLEATAYIQDYTLECVDSESDGPPAERAQDPEVEEFTSKLQLTATAHSELVSEIQDLKGEVRIQQAMVRQLVSDLDETRGEAAQLQKAKDALQERVDELSKEKAEAQMREQEKQNELQRLQQQLSLVEKESKWERRLLAQQQGLLKDELGKMTAPAHGHGRNVAETETLGPLHGAALPSGSDVTESHSQEEAKSKAAVCQSVTGAARRAGCTPKSSAATQPRAHKGPVMQPYVPLVDFHSELE